MYSKEELKKNFKSVSYIKDEHSKTFYIKGYVDNIPYVKIQPYNSDSHGDMPLFEEPTFLPFDIWNAFVQAASLLILGKEKEI